MLHAVVSRLANASVCAGLRSANGSEARKEPAKGDREGWLKDDPQVLFARLREEAFELEDAMRSVKSKMNVVGVDRVKIINEAADVANFAMMIADKFGGCEPRSANSEVSGADR